MMEYKKIPQYSDSTEIEKVSEDLSLSLIKIK